MPGCRVSFFESDLRQAGLCDCIFRTTGFADARLADGDVRGAAGLVMGPIDVGGDAPHVLDGPELQSWFAANGAPDVEVYSKAQ